MATLTTHIKFNTALLLLVTFLFVSNIYDRCPIGKHLDLVQSFNHFHIDIKKKYWKKSGVVIVTPCLMVDLSLVVDDTSSTWDHLRDFAPEEERNEREEEEEKKIDEVGEVANQRGANSLVIIPGSWQKGELLGCGSFGTVYEGISE